MTLSRAAFLDLNNWSVEEITSPVALCANYALVLRLPQVSLVEAAQSQGGYLTNAKSHYRVELKALLDDLASISDLRKDATLAKSRVSNIAAGLGRFAKMLGMEEASTPEQIITALETHLMRQALGLPVTTEKK